MDGSASWVVVGPSPTGGDGRVGATNIGKLRQGKARGGVTSWNLRVFAGVVGFMGCLLLAASLLMSAVHQVQFRNGAISVNFRGLQELKQNFVTKEHVEQIMHGRLIQMATLATTKNESDSDSFALWEEPYKQARKWKPCAAKHSLADEEPGENNNGYILISANGGLNQQRVAVCNAVVVAALLNATLVLPRFLYSSVWKDKSQFGDIYQEDYFVNYMKSDVHIVKDLPPHLQSLDLVGGRRHRVERVPEEGQDHGGGVQAGRRQAEGPERLPAAQDARVHVQGRRRRQRRLLSSLTRC